MISQTEVTELQKKVVRVPILTVELEVKLSIHDLVEGDEKSVSLHDIRNRVTPTGTFFLDTWRFIDFLVTKNFPEEWRAFVLFPTQISDEAVMWCLKWRSDLGRWDGNSCADDAQYGVEAKHLRFNLITKQ